MEPRGNLVLLGFMGTGKSAVGRRIAALAGAPFFEMDAELEQRAGKPISRIFSEDGEAAFRDLESHLADEWGKKEGAVISCGGGVALREENLRALGANGLLVCLTARPEIILERTARSKKRPLLTGENPEQKIRDLLAARAPVYAKIPVQIDTSDEGLAELAARIFELWKKPA